MKRTVLPILFACAAAGLFIWLGFWQLSRLRDRKERNAGISARLQAPSVAIGPTVGGVRPYQRIRVAGEFDFEREVVLTHRTRNGSPGVHLITPLRVAGTDTAILVNRGWVYSPDASRVDASGWREPGTGPLTGWAQPVPEGGTASGPPGGERRVPRLDHARLAALLPYPVARFVLVAEGDTAARAGRPARLAAPILDDGPHLSYAIQWFAFAAIALGGTGIWLALQRGRGARRDVH